ncbi:ABC transporter permease subunit [Clostridium grantii]|uniref:ABC-2 type transport system permease protein n=1 Tax=Clostridium grantii DSM 8605 TaxID=1121316 RepID=A0A1M5S3W6_9CLOT|nr:ABC transporter permease subunit [Clostridium grantii]SHH33184.1 ABC-2 type transport system permease protein [Clostridium grantii DSM 8605]
MSRLLKAEIFKLFKNKTFIVLCIVAFALGIFNFGMTNIVSSEDFIRSSLTNMTEAEKDEAIEQIKLATEVKSSDEKVIVQPGRIGSSSQFENLFSPKGKEIFHSAFGQGLMEILLSILIAALIAKEYSSGTIKNMIAYGKKREDYYIAKFLVASIGGMILMGIIVIFTCLPSLLFFPWGKAFDINEVIYIILIFAGASVSVMAMVSLLMLLASILKSNGSTIGIGISIFVLLPTIVSFLYGKYTLFDKVYESTVSYNYALATAIYASNNDIIKAVTISIATIIISLLIGITLFKKQDIK